MTEETAPPGPRTELESFDLASDVPSGTMLLVASAGTGKTYAIAALASRFVATGAMPLTDMLLITFTRAATRELRERIRDRLVESRDALDDPDAARGHRDPVIRALAEGTPDDVVERRDRLIDALANFDSATIATTHEFCSEMLASLGVGADVDPVETLVEDLSELRTEVANDTYVRQFSAPDAGNPPELTYQTAMDIAEKVINDPIASLDAGPAPPDTQAFARQRFALAVRTEVEQRRRERSLVSYDDLIGRLAAALRTEGAAEANRQRLRDRYRLVMVDEFQDTDALQWQILFDAFHGHRDLILIGDPKQAIYGFRGGDVFTYLHADRSAVQHRATMTDNWRSDAELVEDISRLFGGVALGHEEIRLNPVRAQHARRLSGAPVAAGLRLRMISDKPPGGVDGLRRLIARDVAAEISGLLASGATLTTEHGTRPLSAGDVAVLNASWREAEMVRRALTEVGIPSVLTGADSVFAGSAAGDWLRLLRAIERPQHQADLRAAMLTPLIGCSGSDLVHDGDQAADRAAGMVRGWAIELASNGVAAMVANIVADTDLFARLLARPDGERTITDLMHVAELLHAHARGGAGIAALIAWLGRQIRAAGRNSEDAGRRMETDAPAVHLLTIHGSKGLEFPVVHVPFMWSKRPEREECAVVFHRDHHRLIDVRGPSASRSWSESVAAGWREDAGEDLRRLYVAMTRAGCQAVAWWAAASRNTPHAPLHRLLAARIAGATTCEQRYPLDAVDAAGAAALGLRVELVTDRSAVAPVIAGAVLAPDDLAAAPFDRSVDTAWRRTSYSGLTRAAHEAAYEQERLTGERDDEPAAEGDEAAPAGTGDGDNAAQMGVPAAIPNVSSPMADMPKGATFGTLVHHVLELMRTGADVATELRRCSAEALAHRPVAGVTAGQLATALGSVVTTPLGPRAGDSTLWQIPTSHRLSELEFELPLAPDRAPPAAAVLMADVAALLAEHLRPDDPFASYPDRLAAGGITGTRLLGYLSGSIDAVLRVGREDDARFVVVDYKTNWLGSAAAGELTAASYTPAAMAREMLHAHYPLQALLYCVALHRYLRWRLPAYDPATHLGGVQYLFVRGMCGPHTPVADDGTPYGVFSWDPGADLVTALSDRLNGSR